jgi:hypothetical protein
LYASSIIYRPFTFALPYWSPSQPSPTSVSSYVADGSDLAQGIHAFLLRKVKKIMYVQTPSTTLQPESVWNVTANPRNNSMISYDFASYFGALEIGFTSSILQYSKNQVFSFDDWPRVVKGLQAAQAKGTGIVATFDLTTVENTWWGIKAGFTTELTVFYVGRVWQWENKLSNKYKTLLVPYTWSCGIPRYTRARTQ